MQRGPSTPSSFRATPLLAPPATTLGACRALGRESEKVTATGQNSTISQANSYSIGQESGGF